MHDELSLPVDHYQAGLIIGQKSHKIMHKYILASETRQSLTTWIGSQRLKHMENAARSAFTDYVVELAGVADGCKLPFTEYFPGTP